MIPSFEQRHSRGRLLRYLKSDAPDMSGQNAAALMSAQLSKEQLEWAKQIYESEAPARKAAADRANAISDASLASMQQNDALSKEYADYQRNTFRPLEKGIVADAENFDTEGYREQQAGLAGADVNQSFSMARDQGARQMQRMGVNPNDGRMAAMTAGQDSAQALALAAGKNQARQAATTQAFARKMDAASLGRNLASNQATSAGVALQAGNNSAGQSLGSLTPGNQANAQMSQGYAGALQGQQVAGNIYGNIAQQQAASNNNAGMWGALGSVAGAAGAYIKYSDRNMKENIRPVDNEKSLALIRNTPVALWRYKDDSPAADGGQQRLGPMAQDLQAAAGDDVAPGGKMIDLVSANGLAMSAIQELDKKVQSIAGQVGWNRGAKATEPSQSRRPTSMAQQYGGRTEGEENATPARFIAALAKK